LSTILRIQEHEVLVVFVCGTQMDLENLSVASISANKQANYILEAQVAIAKKVNQQPEVAASLIQAAVSNLPEPGKGSKLDVIA
jgi:hypothetical protein